MITLDTDSVSQVILLQWLADLNLEERPSVKGVRLNIQRSIVLGLLDKGLLLCDG